MSNNEEPTIWAFNKADDPQDRQLIYQSVRNGKSRFGWSSKDTNNLLKEENRQIEENLLQLRLLEVKPGDWIVHRNTPEYRHFIAARVTSGYQFDEGLPCPGRTDFRHCFEVDTDTIVEFDPRDPNVLPTVHLNQRKSLERIYQVDDFLASIKNLKEGAVELSEGESKEGHHLRAKTGKELSVVTQLIHETHKGKNLEAFLAQVLRKTPGVEKVDEHGKGGWRTDHGADLIVTMRDPLDFVRTIIVQVKSFGGEHYELGAVEQVRTGIKKFDGDAGMIITTAKRTEELEDEIERISKNIDRPITLLAGPEVGAFVIKHAPELLFNLSPR